MSKLRMAMALHICAVVVLLFSFNAANAGPIISDTSQNLIISDTSQNLSNFSSALGNDASSNDVQFAMILLDDPTFVFTVTNTSDSPQTYTIRRAYARASGPSNVVYKTGTPG